MSYSGPNWYNEQSKLQPYLIAMFTRVSLLAEVGTHVSRARIDIVEHSIAHTTLAGAVLRVFPAVSLQWLLACEHRRTHLTAVEFTRVFLHVVHQLCGCAELSVANLTLGLSLLLNLWLDLLEVWKQDGKDFSVRFSLDLHFASYRVVSFGLHIFRCWDLACHRL